MAAKKTIDFDSLTPEEVQALSGKQLDAYNAHVLAKSGATPPAPPDAPPAAEAPKEKAAVKIDVRKIGKEYLEKNPDTGFDSVIVASDGTIFPGSPKGKNNAENYAKEAKVGLQEVNR